MLLHNTKVRGGECLYSFHGMCTHSETSVRLAEVERYHNTLIETYVKLQQELCELEVQCEYPK